MSPLARKLYNVNRQRFSEAANPLRSHGPDHHLRVYQHALTLAKKIDVSYDDDILAGACLLHDMAAYYPELSGENYHDFDHKIVAEILAEINFPAKKIAATVYAIANHGSDTQYKKADELVEVTLLRDADKLDVFGPIGIARIIMVRTLKGDTLPEIVEDFYTNGHLKQKWDSITYDATRELAGDDYEYSLTFFKHLTATLTANDQLSPT